jgi:hypothetical protein
MKLLALFCVALFSIGCGKVVSNAIVEPQSSPAILDEPSCSLALDDVPVRARGAFSPERTGLRWSGVNGNVVLELSCNYAHESSGFLRSVTLKLDDVKGSGVYPATVLANMDATDGKGFLSGVDCSVNLQTSAQAAAGPMRATFDCDDTERFTNRNLGLTGQRISGIIVAPPMAPPKRPSCSMELNGTYKARAIGTAGVGSARGELACDSVGSDGSGYRLSIDHLPSDQLAATLWVTRDWSLVEFRGTCETTVLFDDGPGRRFVADVSCNDMVAPDGSRESLTTHIDGKNLPPR